MSKSAAPKQWKLTEDESATSIETWKHNLLYVLAQDTSLVTFLAPDFSWTQYHPVDAPNRGFRADAATVQGAQTAVQKNLKLENLLRLIASWCPVINLDFFLKRTKCLDDVWRIIREHYGIQQTGAHILDLLLITYDPAEKPETLYQRLYTFFSDNLCKAGELVHHGVNVSKNEEMSPLVESVIVEVWLSKMHPKLPQVVKQEFATALQTSTLASLKGIISQSLTALMQKIDDIHVMRTSARSTGQSSHQQFQQMPAARPHPKCTLCSKVSI